MPVQDTTRINDRIRVPQVRLIDETGSQLGVMDTNEALRHPKTDEEFKELLDRRAWCESRLRLTSP